ncbi:MAG: rRNA maturation RNase YbeY [Pyramidobacter sp.]|jgi:probable rRNA maturation factor
MGKLPLTRYKLKKLRKKKPEIRLLISGDSASDLCSLVEENRDALQATCEELYDLVWPDWKRRRTLEISLQFLDETEMASVNGRYRDVDAPTDVLTFPLFERDGQFLPDDSFGSLALGDILLCPSMISKNAEDHDVSETSELALVIFHGMLHLLAWDHDTPEKESKMWAVQERFRDLFLSRIGENAPLKASQ